MRQTAMITRLAVLVGTALVAVLAVSGLAWAATALAVTKTVPVSGATEVARTANVQAYFNHDMKASTFTSSTFKIRKQGTTTWLGATRSVNNTISPTSTNGSSQSVATLNPNSDLAANTTYQVMVVGGSSGVKDINGNALSANKSWTFTTVTPPNTTIDSGPTGATASTSASFAFSSSKVNSTFKCSLDNSTFAACASPKNYPGPLSQGSHTFRVRAIDASGIQDPTPSSRSWTVDTVGPNATITDGPTSRSNSLSASFTFSGAESGGSYECKIDAAGSPGTFSACSSGQSFTVDTDGTYTFSVQASDALGNFGTPASYTWTADTVAPNTTIDTKPANPSNSASASFTFSSNENGSSFECKLDNEASFTSCPAAGKSYTNLSDVSHTFSVRAIDAAGNVDGSPDSYTWTVDAVSGVTVTPNPLDLSPTDPLFCSSRQENLTVTNNGPGDVTFAEATITGPDAAYFSDGAKSFIQNNGPFTVLDGNFFQDQVRFSPGSTPTDLHRNYSATLTYKDGAGATIGSPVSLTATTACLVFP